MSKNSDRTDLEIIHHEGYNPNAKVIFVPAIKVHSGKLVVLSGVTAADPYHDHPHRPEQFESIPEDIAGQTELIFKFMDLALLAASCERKDIVSLSRYFTNLIDDQDKVNELQKEWLDGHVPTSTSVGVTSLAAHPKLRLEITATAVCQE